MFIDSRFIRLVLKKFDSEVTLAKSQLLISKVFKLEQPPKTEPKLVTLDTSKPLKFKFSNKVPANIILISVALLVLNLLKSIVVVAILANILDIFFVLDELILSILIFVIFLKLLKK